MNKIQDVWGKSKTKDMLEYLKDEGLRVGVKYNKRIYIVRNYIGKVVLTARQINTGYVVYYNEEIMSDFESNNSYWKGEGY